MFSINAMLQYSCSAHMLTANWATNFALCKSAATQLQGWQHHFVILTDALGKGP